MDRTEVLSSIRACLVTRKGMVPLKLLDDDFCGIIGHRIPFRNFGFPSLEAFVRSEPSLIVTEGREGILVDARISEKSAHVSELVRKQKTDKKRMNFRPVRPARPYMPQRSFVQPRTKQIQSTGYQKSPRPDRVAHNQFVSVSSKVVIPPHSTFGQNGTTAQKPSPPCSGVDDKPVTNATTVISNARKRIQEKMAAINLEPDSGNSSPTNEEATPIASNSGDAIKDLKRFVEYHKLGPIDISFNKISMRNTKLHTCKMRVDNQTFNSYPIEVKSQYDAEVLCAKLALVELTAKYGKRKSLLISSEKDILERIPNMLKKHSSAIWIWQLEKDYTDKYNEILPEDWLKVIDISPCIQLEKCQSNHIVRYCEPGDKGKVLGTSFMLTDISVPSNTVHLVNGEYISGMVTCIMSANEVWCQQTCTQESEAYHKMVIQMEEYYNKHSRDLLAEHVNIGRHYVARYEDSWYRIKIVEKNAESNLVLFIDFGDSVEVPSRNIYQLKREFATSQAQAFVCRLVGLEQLYNESESSDAIQAYLYENVNIEVDSEASIEDGDVALPVYLFNSENGECINDVLFKELMIESTTPAFERDILPEVYVSNIEPNGDVYVQIRSASFSIFKNLLHECQLEVMSKPNTGLLKTVTKENSEGRLYFFYSKSDKNWHRVKLIDWSPDQKLSQLYYVDIGKTEIVQVAHEAFYQMEDLNDVLNEIPPQAVKIKIAIKTIPKDFVVIAKRQMPEDQPVVLKIVGYMDSTPVGEFFRAQPEGMFSITGSIQMEEEVKNSSSELVVHPKKTTWSASKNVPSGGKLKPPQIPKVQDYFKVHIPLAVNPYNFFIQPLESLHQLSSMMLKLQEKYKDAQYSPLAIDDIVPGNIYASKHKDGNWYRTSVIKVINPSSISVFYCDYGYYANLTVQQLIPLDVEFMELPYQALKAKVANIKPKNNKWSVTDCENFKELVERKDFYSMLLAVEKDELYESDIVLSLTLIDTSTDDDIYINKILAEKGIAVEIQ